MQRRNVAHVNAKDQHFDFRHKGGGRVCGGVSAFSPIQFGVVLPLPLLLVAQLQALERLDVVHVFQGFPVVLYYVSRERFHILLGAMERGERRARRSGRRRRRHRWRWLEEEAEEVEVGWTVRSCRSVEKVSREERDGENHTEQVKIGQCAGKYRNVNQRQNTHSPQWSKGKNLRGARPNIAREKKKKSRQHSCPSQTNR